MQHYKIIKNCVTILLLSLNLKAQNIGIGTNNPRANVHIVTGTEGIMEFPYESLVVEKSDDSKLGVYSTSSNPVNYKASSIALGYTNYKDNYGNFPSFETQYGVWNNPGFILRFNALNINTSGQYVPLNSYGNILIMDTKGHVGINLTQGQAVAPIEPTANLHVNGTVKFQNLPYASSGGNYLVVENGKLKISSGYIS
ncbi:hypothetical protein [Ferruginibacter sp.]|uniref:hypothetical protein n=1 Tax=Ferruginibacter sp. TaxID=1940288 RepID=UPI00374D735C